MRGKERSGATANGILCEGVEESIAIREASGRAFVRKPRLGLNVVIGSDGDS